MGVGIMDRSVFYIWHRQALSRHKDDNSWIQFVNPCTLQQLILTSKGFMVRLLIIDKAPKTSAEETLCQAH